LLHIAGLSLGKECTTYFDFEKEKLTDDFFQITGPELAYVCKKLGIVCNFTF
jgi:hypothetical protein